MNKVLVNVEGGLGKNIMAVSLMKQLKKKYDEIYVISPYFDIFKACPYVKDSFPIGHPGLYEQLVLRDDVEILWKEPYNNNNFIKKKIHLLDAWSKEFDIEYDENTIPEIDVTKLDSIILEDVNKIKEDINGKYIVIQFSGGQSPIAMTNQCSEILKRNYFQGNELTEVLKENYKIINFSLPNEPEVSHSRRLQAPYIYYIELVKGAEFVIAIDSSLQHIAASTNTQTFVLWGETRPEHFGWKKHINLTKPITNTAPYFKPMGPSSIIIDFTTPEEILNEIEKKGYRI